MTKLYKRASFWLLLVGVAGIVAAPLTLPQPLDFGIFVIATAVAVLSFDSLIREY